MDTGQKLRELLSESQRVALDAVMKKLVEDPSSLDNRKGEDRGNEEKAAA